MIPLLIIIGAILIDQRKTPKASLAHPLRPDFYPTSNFVSKDNSGQVRGTNNFISTARKCG